MNGLCETAPVDLHDTKRIHNAWKSKMHNLIHNPFPWKKINSRHAENETSSGSLDTLLSQKSGQLAFRDFLKSEFCEENLDFWIACEEFKALDDLEELTHRAALIYDKFISPESPTQVNLEFYTKEIIRQNLHQPSPSCFTEAQKKIFSLMQNGAYTRFIQSGRFKLQHDTTSQQRSLEKHQKALRIKSAGDLIQHKSKPITLHSDLYLFV
ncbi:regulator of G-protein signaling 21-like [Aulostomus maculatus]